MILVLSILALNGCNGVSPSSTARPGPETTSKEAPEVTSKEAPEVTSKTNYEGLLAWYYPFPHPFGEACKAGIDAYVRDTGIPVKVLIGPEFTMTSEIESVEALMGQGYKHYGIFSVDTQPPLTGFTKKWLQKDARSTILMGLCTRFCSLSPDSY